MSEDRRELAWKDAWLDYDIGDMSSSDTEGDTVDNELVLPPEEKTVVAISVTGSEYNQLFASTSLGADLLYSEKSHSILWLIWKAVKMGTFCSQVANCIDTSIEVRDALIEIGVTIDGNSGVGNPEKPLSDSTLGENLLPDDFECDNDHRYGTSVGVVDAINDATVEVFQAIEILTNPLELAAEIADNMPLAEAAAVAAEMILWIQNTIFEAYELAWSDTVKDEISCEIYCLMLDHEPCHLDYDMVFDVYKDLSGAAPPSLLAPWVDWFEWLITIPLTNNVLTVKVAGLMGLLVMRYGGKFGSFVLGVRSFGTTIELLKDATNNDWETLCVECPSRWTETWDFIADGPGDWFIDGDGVFQAGVGFVGELVNNGGQISNIIQWLTYPGNILRHDTTTVFYDNVKGHFDANQVCMEYLDNPADPLTYTQAFFPHGVDERSHNFAIQTTTDNVRIYLRSCWQNDKAPPNYGQAIITGMSMSGIGINPFS